VGSTLENTGRSSETRLQAPGLILSDFIFNNCYFYFVQWKSHAELYLIIALSSIILKINRASLISSGGTTLPPDKQHCLQHQPTATPTLLSDTSKRGNNLKI